MSFNPLALLCGFPGYYRSILLDTLSRHLLFNVGLFFENELLIIEIMWIISYDTNIEPTLEIKLTQIRTHENLVWNCQGSSWPGFISQALFYITSLRLDLFCLVDTRATLDGAKNIASRLQFDNFCIACTCHGSMWWSYLIVEI